MNKIVVIIVLSTFGAFAYKPTTAFYVSSRYSLVEVESNPIPKRAAMTLWQVVALDDCEGALKNHNISPEKCREIKREKHSECATSSSRFAPDVIADRIQSKALGREYLECITPYYFCNGVEVRTDEEARTHCT